MYTFVKMTIITIYIKKKLKNLNYTRLISPIGSDSITIFFPVKILLFQLFLFFLLQINIF
jgi:hypothetical protein